MTGALRFEVLITPDVPWETAPDRFRCIEALGFDLGGLADHFVDWTHPPNPWCPTPGSASGRHSAPWQGPGHAARAFPRRIAA